MNSQETYSPASTSQAGLDQGRRGVLIIDDEEDFLLLMRLTLEQTGRYKVRGEADPRRALQLARELHPDVILLDVMMPELDGGDVAASLHADPVTSRIPIIFLTALVGARETPAGLPLQSGGELFLPKPVQFAELERCIDILLAAKANTGVA